MAPLMIAYPRSFGHVTNRSKNLFKDLIQSQKDSKGCKKTQTILTAKAKGHATKINSISQRMDMQGFCRAMISFVRQWI